MFNKYFGSVGIIDTGVYTKRSNTEPTSVLETVIFTERDVLLAIKLNRLKPNLSCGPDGLPPLLFKRLKDSLAYLLALIFTQLFSVGIIPDE